MNQTNYEFSQHGLIAICERYDGDWMVEAVMYESPVSKTKRMIVLGPFANRTSAERHAENLQAFLVCVRHDGPPQATP